MKRSIIMLVLLCLAATVVLAQTGVKKKRPLPPEYGRVVMNNFSEQAGLPAVEFDHWLHRTRYTCRLCHLDLAFAMKAGASSVRAADNRKGYYCGACHNGKKGTDGRTVFESCAATWSKADLPKCERCHSRGRTVKREFEFEAVTGKFPRERYGNEINWEKAEQDGLIKLTDALPGVSIPRQQMAIQKDFAIAPVNVGIPEVIFSHKKHTVWNGCEVCHPEIFLGVKKGNTKYTMIDIYAGKFCGVCHSTVAFPVIDCQRCHTKPVQPS